MDELEIWKFVVGALLGVCLASLFFLFVVFSGVI